LYEVIPATAFTHRVQLLANLVTCYINRATLTSTLFKSKVLFHTPRTPSHKYSKTLQNKPAEANLHRVHDKE